MEPAPFKTLTHKEFIFYSRINAMFLDAQRVIRIYAPGEFERLVVAHMRDIFGSTDAIAESQSTGNGVPK